MKAIFDIETDGVNASKVWCIAAQIYGMPWETYFFDPSEVGNFKQWLVDNDIDTLIGHNIIGFDIPVLNKLLDLDWSGDIEDTLVMARLDDPSRKNMDIFNEIFYSVISKIKFFFNEIRKLFYLRSIHHGELSGNHVSVFDS